MNDIKEIKEKVGVAARDIIVKQLNLERVGTKYRCPNKIAHRHGDRSPSMSWDDNLLQFKCFGCGQLLDIYSLYKDCLNYTHAEIVREFLDKEYAETSIVKNRRKFENYAKELLELDDIQKQYLKMRKLDEATVQTFRLRNYQGSIAFPYYRNEVMIGCKTRKPLDHVDGPKYLSLPGSKPGFFNYDRIEQKNQLIICEGEFDCLIIYQSGFQNVVSVGSGANSLSALIDQYKEFLDGFDNFIIFSDNDEAGAHMDETLLNAFPSKAMLVDKSIMQYKDANEEYLHGGAASIKRIIESAQEKIEGFFNPDTDNISLEELFNRGRFISTGLPSIDYALNDLAPGSTTLVAGRSNGGKSTFVIQVIANAIESKNKVLLISGEDDKRILVNKIYLAVIGRRPELYDVVHINKRQLKVPKEGVEEQIKKWHRNKIHLFMKGEASLKTTEELFMLISRKIKLDKYNLVVIDNLMSVLSVKSVAEKYEEQASFMQRCCDIAKLYHCHIIIVVHPNKTYQKGEQMDFEQISGTSDLANKADNVISILREYEEDEKLKGIDGYCEILKNRYFPDLIKICLHYDEETSLLLEYDVDRKMCSYYNFNLGIK